MTSFLESNIRLFHYYKSLADGAMTQVSDDVLFHQANSDSNSIAIIVQHMWGNMISRWTDFLTTDGEKEGRKRDEEFEAAIITRKIMLDRWEAGWTCLFNALNALNNDDFVRIVYIRNEGHSVMDAISRQVAHYAYHVGQIVLLAKALRNGEWRSLSIPKNASSAYNADKFSQEKAARHFTEDF